MPTPTATRPPRWITALIVTASGSLVAVTLRSPPVSTTAVSSISAWATLVWSSSEKAPEMPTWVALPPCWVTTTMNDRLRAVTSTSVRAATWAPSSMVARAPSVTVTPW